MCSVEESGKEGMENSRESVISFFLFGIGEIKGEEKWVKGVYLMGPTNIFLSPN